METDSALVLVGSTQPSIPYGGPEKRFGEIKKRVTEREKSFSEAEKHISDVEIRFQKTLLRRTQHSHSVGEVVRTFPSIARPSPIHHFKLGILTMASNVAINVNALSAMSSKVCE